jgi:hypothetical protein
MIERLYGDKDVHLAGAAEKETLIPSKTPPGASPDSFCIKTAATSKVQKPSNLAAGF